MSQDFKYGKKKRKYPQVRHTKNPQVTHDEPYRGCPKPRKQALVLVFGVGRVELVRNQFRNKKNVHLWRIGMTALPSSRSPCCGIVSAMLVVVVL